MFFNLKNRNNKIFEIDSVYKKLNMTNKFYINVL